MMRQKTAETIRDGKGWFWPMNSRKAHYYDQQNQSLCGKWFVFKVVDPDGFDSPAGSDDCKACRTKVDAAHEALEASNA